MATQLLEDLKVEDERESADSVPAEKLKVTLISLHGLIRARNPELGRDADTIGAEPFGFCRIEPVRAVSFSSHSVQPQALLALAEDLFGRRVEGYLLGIRGYAFNEYAERLSERAKANLLAAIPFIEEVVRERSFRRVANRLEPGSANGAPSEDMTCKTANT